MLPTALIQCVNFDAVRFETFRKTYGIYRDMDFSYRGHV